MAPKQRHRGPRRQLIKAAPLPDLPRIFPRLTLLSQDDCNRIHEASCQILKSTGVKVYSRDAIALLKSAGAKIQENLVIIPPELVETALKSVPSEFNLFYRSSDTIALKLDGKEVYFGPGSDTLRYLDPKSQERRPFLLADIADCIRLCDALSEINFVMSVGVPSDVPPEKYFWYQYAEMLRNTRKPSVVVCDSLEDLKAITAIASAAAGGIENLSRNPNILLYSEPTSPLQHSQNATEKLLYCAQHSIPITHSPAPMMGGTAPITIAGAVALGNAEVLSSLVIHQLKNQGAPFLYGHGVHHLDMKEMISVYGAPEFQLARIMAAEMARFYNLPAWGYTGHTDSKVVDGQAAADGQFSALVAFLAKTNLNHDVGYLESGLTNSPEMMVMMDEIISMTRRFAAGIRLDNEALALNVIHEVGPGGEFLSHEHTHSHWRELWLPQIFDRQRLEPWEIKGSKNVNVQITEKTISIMDTHKVSPLSESIEREIQAILQD